MTTFSPGAAPPKPPHPAANGVAVLSGEIWLEAVTALHERIRADMPERSRCFLLPRTPDYFRDLLSGKTGVLFGAFADGELVGSMALVGAESFVDARASGRLTCPDAQGLLAKKYRTGSVAIVQSMGLSGAYMGRGHSRLLLQAAAAEAQKKGCPHMFAQVAEQNTLSWLRFMDQGFAIVSAWTSGHKRFLLRWLAPEERSRLLRKKKGVERHVYGKSYAQMPALLSELEVKLAQGKIAFLDSGHNDGGLPFVFIC